MVGLLRVSWRDASGRVRSGMSGMVRLFFCVCSRLGGRSPTFLFRVWGFRAVAFGEGLRSSPGGGARPAASLRKPLHPFPFALLAGTGLVSVVRSCLPEGVFALSAGEKRIFSE